MLSGTTSCEAVKFLPKPLDYLLNVISWGNLDYPAKINGQGIKDNMNQNTIAWYTHKYKIHSKFHIYYSLH